jgi:hypothetical protein
MISTDQMGCERFQRVASAWLRSGEITRTNNLLSPLEELAGFNYGFVYLLDLDGGMVKIGYSEHPVRRMRELRAGFRYGERLRLRACFVGEPEEERTLHRRFAHLRIENERFLISAAIDAEFACARERASDYARCIAAAPSVRRSSRDSICGCSVRGYGGREALTMSLCRSQGAFAVQIEAQPREHSSALCDRGCNEEVYRKCPCPSGYGRDDASPSSSARLQNTPAMLPRRLLGAAIIGAITIGTWTSSELP